MPSDPHQKIEARHLKRKAYLYVRQSTFRQVLENQESTKRQYALREGAVQMGWQGDQVVVIDEDLGRSGATSADRTGFQRLVADVGTGQAGVVMGLEFSRLARNSSDWHRLLEICALTDTLLLDEDGLYDPAHFNDRLLLGLKGTMSEAELHVLKARLQGGLRAKARRGELVCPLPTGLCYDASQHVMLDPDAQVQAAIRMVFHTFARGESACGVVKHLRQHGLQLPVRQRHGPHKGELFWRDATHSRILDLLHNPRYAGAFFYGRCRQRRRPNGARSYEKLPQDQWLACKTEAHPGYIDWATWQDNQKRLLQSANGFGGERRAGPPREGPALLQGIVLCGRCGKRMTVSYHAHGRSDVPIYKCETVANQRAQGPRCQLLTGKAIDQAVARELLAAVTPLAVNLTMEIQKELEQRHAEADALRHMEVQRASEQVELARRRYLRVDPDRRMVADALEADWNAALRALDGAQQDYGRWQQDQLAAKDRMPTNQLAELASDFQRLWNDPGTPDRERKRMLRLLVADVTLHRREGGEVDVHVRYKTGATRTLTIEKRLQIWQLRKTPAAVLTALDDLLNDHTDAQVAAQLHAMGMRTGTGQAFCTMAVQNLRKDNGLPSHYRRLQARGMLTLHELAERVGVCTATIRVWRGQGRLRCHLANDRGEYLYEESISAKPASGKVKRVRKDARGSGNLHDASHEVQYAG